jgi:hypothetical protein
MYKISSYQCLVPYVFAFPAILATLWIVGRASLVAEPLFDMGLALGT